MWMLMYFVLWKVCAKKNTYYILLLILMKVPVLVPEPNCICNPYLASVLQACWAQYNTLVCGLCRVGAKKYTCVLLLLMLELEPGTHFDSVVLHCRKRLSDREWWKGFRSSLVCILLFLRNVSYDYKSLFQRSQYVWYLLTLRFGRLNHSGTWFW